VFHYQNEHSSSAKCEATSVLLEVTSLKEMNRKIRIISEEIEEKQMNF